VKRSAITFHWVLREILVSGEELRFQGECGVSADSPARLSLGPWRSWESQFLSDIRRW